MCITLQSVRSLKARIILCNLLRGFVQGFCDHTDLSVENLYDNVPTRHVPSQETSKK